MKNSICRGRIVLSEKDYADILKLAIIYIEKNIDIEGENDIFNVNCTISSNASNLKEVFFNIIITSKNEGKKITFYHKTYNKSEIRESLFCGIIRLILKNEDIPMFLINIVNTTNGEDVEYLKEISNSQKYFLSKIECENIKEVVENELIYRSFENEEELALATFCILTGCEYLDELLQLYIDKLYYIGIDINDYYHKYKFDQPDIKDIISSEDSQEKLEYMINLVNLIIKGEVDLNKEKEFIPQLADHLFRGYLFFLE